MYICPIGPYIMMNPLMLYQQESRNQRYTYSYSKLGDSPRDLPSPRPLALENGAITANSVIRQPAAVIPEGGGGGLEYLQPGDTCSMRSDWSRTSSPPPTEEIIQVYPILINTH